MNPINGVMAKANKDRDALPTWRGEACSANGPRSTFRMKKRAATATRTPQTTTRPRPEQPPSSQRVQSPPPKNKHSVNKRTPVPLVTELACPNQSKRPGGTGGPQWPRPGVILQRAAGRLQGLRRRPHQVPHDEIKEWCEGHRNVHHRAGRRQSMAEEQQPAVRRDRCTTSCWPQAT